MWGIRFILVAAAIVAGPSWISPASADQISGAKAKEMCAKGDVGPVTAYGEFPEEAAAKRLVFNWNCMVQVEGKIREAFEKYVDKGWCDHGHLITKGQDRCGTYAEALVMFSHMSKGKPLRDTDTIEFPVMSAVNGDHVTMYGVGVDIFRVANGKITDHWDASPPRDVSLKAHSPEFPKWVMGGMKGPMPP